MRSPVFGKTVFRNIFASDDNPIKYGIYVRTFRRRGKMNPGTYYELTDGKGYFWEVEPISLEEEGETK